eukprot:2561990-Amphidinium_carterae.1
MAATNPVTNPQQQALTVAGVPLASPTSADGDPAELFKRLCTQFRIDDRVATYLVTTMGVESLEDFKYLFTTEAEISSTVIANIAELERKPLMAARLRQAWHSVQTAQSVADAQRKRGREAEDLDALLPEQDLTNLKTLFWSRYKLDFNISTEPSDFLVSRISRELQKRLLQVHSVWRTKTLTHQLKQERKKQRVAEGVELVFQEME